MKKWFKKYKIIIWSLVFIVLPIGLFSLTYHAFVTWKLPPAGENLGKSDWLAFLGSFLGFIGSTILGLVAILQTQIALKHNKEVFMADKYSTIKIRKDCYFELLENSLTRYKNIHKYPVNQYFVKSNKNFDFNEDLVMLNLQMYYDSVNLPIKKIELNEIRISYQWDMFVNRLITTDLCSKPKSKEDDEYGQLEIVFILTKEELESFKKLLKNNLLIINFNFQIISSFNVVMNENIEINMRAPNKKDYLGKKLKLDKGFNWCIDTISYNFDKGEKLWKENKI